MTDRRTDGQTDGRTDGRTDARGKTICLPTLSGGDIMKYKGLILWKQFTHSKGDTMDYFALFRVMNPNQKPFCTAISKV